MLAAHHPPACAALQELAPFKNCVVATGGGVPMRAENWGHMQVGAGVVQVYCGGLQGGAALAGLDCSEKRPAASHASPAATLPNARLQGGISIWLNGPPTLLAHRVVGDGTATRPLLSQDGGSEGGGGAAGGDAYAAAVARLSALLEERQQLYQISDLTVSLEGSGPDADLGAPAMMVCYRVLVLLNQRIKADTGEGQKTCCSRGAGGAQRSSAHAQSWAGVGGARRRGGAGALCASLLALAWQPRSPAR